MLRCLDDGAELAMCMVTLEAIDGVSPAIVALKSFVRCIDYLLDGYLGFCHEPPAFEPSDETNVPAAVPGCATIRMPVWGIFACWKELSSLKVAL